MQTHANAVLASSGPRLCDKCPLATLPEQESRKLAERGFFCDNDEWDNTTLEAELNQRGHFFAPPGQLSDSEITSELRRLIECLAGLHVFLYSTDHLSDRQLYERLVGTELTNETYLPCQYQDEAMHLDLTGSGSEEDVALYLEYYADDPERQYFAAEFPEMVIPARRIPPFDRDLYLPDRYSQTQAMEAMQTEQPLQENWSHQTRKENRNAI